MPVRRVPAKSRSKKNRRLPQYDSSIQKIVLKALEKTKAFLVLVGKPLLLLLFSIIISSIYVWKKISKTTSSILYITGQTFLFLLKAITLWSKFSFDLTKTLHKTKKGEPKKKRIILSALLIVFLLAFLSWTRFFMQLPQPGQLITRKQQLTTKILDRNGELLFKVYKNQNRTIVPLKELPVWIPLATIAIEDAEFYKHHGFSLRGIARATRKNIEKNQLTGGSTITQQLVKNALLSPEKTFTRKIKEIILSVKVELAFTKDQILEMYLNEVSYGGSTYGIEEASQLYFAKSAKDLDLAESALLAGLPKAPTTYSPFGANPFLAKERQIEVLHRMVQEKFITPEQSQVAKNEKLVFTAQKTDIKAPHFVMYVKQILAEKFGEQTVEESGLEVYTTLDMNIQRMAQEVVKQEVSKIKNLNISNGAALVTNPQTGEVLAMVGSKDYFDQEIDGNFNVTTALRQPGSSIKPINYANALQSRNYTAASLISDSQITFSIPGSTPYSPKNYDNQFHGMVTVRTALASSLNVPAVKVLASYGTDSMIELAKKMGITTWEDKSRFGLSLTLGGGEIKMTDMATVYGTLANNGQRVNLNPILKITDRHGKLLEILQKNNCVHLTNTVEASTPCSQQAIDPHVAFILTDILKDNNARSLAFGTNSLLVIPNHPEVAVKTGTTQNLRDNWAIGYTKNYVVLTWVGNSDNKPMSYVSSGITGATPIWHNITINLLKNKPSHDWPLPDGIIATKICPSTGTLPCNGCGGKTEYFIPGTQPSYACVPREQAEEKKEGHVRGQIL